VYESRHELFLTRRMRGGEEPGVSALIRHVFDEHVAPFYPPEGIAEFKHLTTSPPVQIAIISCYWLSPSKGWLVSLKCVGASTFHCSSSRRAARGRESDGN